MGTSWLAQATVAIRSGWDSIVVSPKACLIVTGNCAAGAEEDAAGSLVGSAEPPQAAKLTAVRAATRVAANRRVLIQSSIRRKRH